MENSKFLKVVIIILLLINLATLGFMWTRKGPPMGPPPHRDLVEFLSRELNLSQEQREKFETLKNEHRASVQSLRENSRELHDAFFDMLSKNPVDKAQVEAMADSMVSQQKQIELSTFYHFQKVREICTPEQQKKFDEVINEALRMMAPGPR